MIIVMSIKTGYDEKYQAGELEQKVQELGPGHVFTHSDHLPSFDTRKEKDFSFPAYRNTKKANRHPTKSESDRIGQRPTGILADSEGIIV